PGRAAGLFGAFRYDGSVAFYAGPSFEVWGLDRLWVQPEGGERMEVAWRSGLGEMEFARSVVAAQERIRAGDIYQVNLTRRLRAELEVEDPFLLFRVLWSRTQAPWAGWLALPEVSLASASPELFLAVDGRRVRTQPIKGTRPRDRDPSRDQRNAFELSTDPKEVAELVMITDLERNDLGQVCEFGSVEVVELVARRSYSHVHHLVSTIEGVLRPGIGPVEAVRACFPGGSITGAPKGKAQEVIGLLEPERRGFYTGALGYLGYDGSARLSMVIRCLEIGQGEVSFGVGSGLTIDSDPGREFVETEQKAAALREAVAEVAGRPLRSGAL
ncbi:MAG: anthranilate synthase component I family protein, partial [Verrucomicrobiia bacterium]